MSLDVLKYGVVAFSLIVMLHIRYMILIDICSHSCTEDVGNHHLLRANPTSFGPNIGSNFMAPTPQDSFGPDLRKIKYSEHHISLADYVQIKSMIQT